MNLVFLILGLILGYLRWKFKVDDLEIIQEMYNKIYGSEKDE